MFVQVEYDIVLKFCGFFGIDVSPEVLSAGVYIKLPVTVLLRYIKFQFCISNSQIALLKDPLVKFTVCNIVMQLRNSSHMMTLWKRSNGQRSKNQ
jgi:hypothetical protein